jgi:hypothetical protein
MMLLTQMPTVHSKASTKSFPFFFLPPFSILVPPPRHDSFRLDNHRNIIVKVALLPPHSALEGEVDDRVDVVRFIDETENSVLLLFRTRTSLRGFFSVGKIDRTTRGPSHRKAPTGVPAENASADEVGGLTLPLLPVRHQSGFLSQPPL